MEDTIRILHVLGSTNLGGAESRIMDLYRAIDRTRVQFDFVVHSEKEGYFDKEILDMGGRIFRVPPFRVYNIMSYKKAFRRLFQSHSEFRMVQGHMTSTASIYLPIAKKAGVKTTIAHARSAGVEKNLKGWITRILRKNLCKKADVLFACSKLAADAVFGEKAWNNGRVFFIPNAVEAGKFCYNPEVREKMREQLGIKDEFVLGHVGSFRYAKNHEYLLQVFVDLLKIFEKNHVESEPVLLLLGSGERMELMREEAKRMGIDKQVRFLGNQGEIWRYYQVFDYIVFPSRYEGMPGTIVEAQAAGIKCLISDRISEDTVFTDLVKLKSIDADPEEWAESVWLDHAYSRLNYYEKAKEKGFDVKGQASVMMDFYINGNFEKRDGRQW